MKLQELRTMGKELGVDSPTTYPKRELVLKIMEKNGIVVDQNDLPAPPKRRGGRQKKDRSQDTLGLEEPTYAEPLAQEDIAVQVEEPGVQPLREAQSAAVLPLFSEDIKPAVSQMLSEGACGDCEGILEITADKQKKKGIMLIPYIDRNSSNLEIKKLIINIPVSYTHLCNAY